MGLFFKASNKQLLEVRNKIFLENGIPALKENGFVESPFSTSWFGWDHNKNFSYELCRTNKDVQLEIITTSIVRGDKWIKIFLNVFELSPPLQDIDSLKGKKGTLFHLPPNSLTRMRLRNNNYYKGPPLFYMLFLPEHKIGSYFSKNGFDKEVHKLNVLINKDMTNIDSFVKRWHELHQPNMTDCEGNRLGVVPAGLRQQP